MRRPPRKPKPNTAPAHAARPAAGPEERAQELLERLRTGGPNPVNAAEELDRLQASLGRAERLDEFREQVADLCMEWSEGPLRGEKSRAWLILAGGYGLSEHSRKAAAIGEDPGSTPKLRIAALRALAVLDRTAAPSVAERVLASRADAQVRTAAAELLAEAGAREALPLLQRLLEEELPRPLWNAVAAAADRLR
jgi:hypothetical protein